MKSSGSFLASGFRGNGWLGSRIMRAVTEIDSGRDRTGWVVNGELNTSLLLWIDPDRSRNLRASGDDSRDTVGDVFFLVNDSLLSAMDGDFEPALLRGFPAKNAGEAPAEGPVVPGGGDGLAAELDSFSRAFIL